MKHTLNITLVLVLMFLLTQAIGLAVIHAYKTIQLPYGMQPPEIKPEISFWSILISIFLAVSFVFLLMKIHAGWVIKLWFFSVISIALAITFNALLQNFVPFSRILALSFGIFFSYIKIFKRNIIFHNLTELLIYPGIAAIFIPLLSLFSVSALLIFISIYDIYAVWYSGFMQKMAKFQIKELKFFAGFFIPYIKGGLKEARQAKKGKKIKISLAILGGGDVVFPILASGVVLNSWGLLPAVIVTLFSTLGLVSLFINARKGEFYPAMPFISAGCFLGLLIAFLVKPFLL